MYDVVVLILFRDGDFADFFWVAANACEKKSAKKFAS